MAKRPLWDVIYGMFWGKKAIGLDLRLVYHRGWRWERYKHSGGILRRGQMVCISSVIVVRELTMKASLNYAFELIA